MLLDGIVSFAGHPATWTIYILVIVGFMLASVWKLHFARDTWTNFFQLWFGVGAFLAGMGFGFQIIGRNLSIGIDLSYSVESIITLIFMIIYIFLLWRLGMQLMKKPGWQWMGIVMITFTLGCIINAILTGGRYLPFVGWLYD